ncbi:MAG: hypothetical protein U9N59_04875, partial [Campylobacterota bacterium]|nr:hypothetical protein [Campylobacterota bacterium]
RLADYCLDHKPQGTIKHYLEFTYEDKVKAYHKYWNFIRGITETKMINEQTIKKTQTNNISNVEALKELRDMVKEGFLTKEEFEIEKSKLF